MQDADHFFEGHVYLISNFSVAKNPLFSNRYYKDRFIYKLKFYLEDLVDIIHYAIDNDQYQILIRLRSRRVFIEFYRRKYRDIEIPDFYIPPSTIILSQCIANLQSSAAIHFNRRERRCGALFARRFRKRLVEGVKDIRDIISAMKEYVQFGKVGKRWRYRAKQDEEVMRGGMLNFTKNTFFKYFNSLDLQGQFRMLPPLNYYDQFPSLKSLKNPNFPP